MFGSRKMGYFEIPEKAFVHPDIVHEILDQVIVLKAEFHYDDMRMHYFGISEAFEEVSQAAVAPHYNIQCQDFIIDGKPLIFVKGDVMHALEWLNPKLYNCLTCYDTQTVTCHVCNGSGEGQADGTPCLACNGNDVRCPDCGMEDV